MSIRAPAYLQAASVSPAERFFSFQSGEDDALGDFQFRYPEDQFTFHAAQTAIQSHGRRLQKRRFFGMGFGAAELPLNLKELREFAPCFDAAEF